MSNSVGFLSCQICDGRDIFQLTQDSEKLLKMSDCLKDWLGGIPDNWLKHESPVGSLSVLDMQSMITSMRTWLQNIPESLLNAEIKVEEPEELLQEDQQYYSEGTEHTEDIHDENGESINQDNLEFLETLREPVTQDQDFLMEGLGGLEQENEGLLEDPEEILRNTYQVNNLSVDVSSEQKDPFDLQQHEKTHEGIIYACDQCDYSANTMELMHKHKRRHEHKNETEHFQGSLKASGEEKHQEQQQEDLQLSMDEGELTSKNLEDDSLVPFQGFGYSMKRVQDGEQFQTLLYMRGTLEKIRKELRGRNSTTSKEKLQNLRLTSSDLRIKIKDVEKAVIDQALKEDSSLRTLKNKLDKWEKYLKCLQTKVRYFKNGSHGYGGLQTQDEVDEVEILVNKNLEVRRQQRSDLMTQWKGKIAELLKKDEFLPPPTASDDIRFEITHGSIMKRANNLECEQCSYKTFSAAKLQGHVESKHLGIIYPCDQCSFVSTSRQYIMRHKKEKH